MILIRKSAGGIGLFLSLLFSNAYPQESFIDILHREISAVVHKTVEQFDNFFADPRVKEETEAYLRLTAGLHYDGRPYYKNIFKTDLKIRLTKLEKSAGLLVENRKNSQEKTVQKPIRHRLSAGISGFPRLYAKYEIFNIPVVYKRWEFTLFQRFRAEYRFTDYRLEERTQLYIDRLIAKQTVWRILIERANISNLHYQLVNYSTAVRVYNPLKKLLRKNSATELSFSITQAGLVNGRAVRYTLQNRTRTNFWKKWAFININIGSWWDKSRGFKGTPFIQVYLEFYTGKY
ncbi:hypothetical protein [Persephonella sp.]